MVLKSALWSNLMIWNGAIKTNNIADNPDDFQIFMAML